MMRIILLATLFMFSVYTYAQEIKIIPQPVEIKMGSGSYTIKNQLQIVYDAKAKSSAEFLSQYLNRFYKVNCKLTESSGQGRDAKTIYLLVGAVDKKEAYQLDVKQNNITITGDEEGIFRGVQTLIQLLPVPVQSSQPQIIKLTIPQLTITDYPRFAYRGLHLDVGRHFMPVDFIKKYIDFIALHKMNYFHWHLPEDQGWRIQIKKYPKLTEVGAWRNGTIIGRYPGTGSDNTIHGGFYTQEEIKDIVKYAADQYITIVPEIEMPGHSNAAIAAYPFLSCFPEEQTKIPANMISKASTQLQEEGRKKLVLETWGVSDDVFCAGNEETFAFLQDVLDEVIALFPGKYIHVGGDECPKENWKRCDNCQTRMKSEKLKDEHELQSYFIQRIEKYINKKGKTLIGWDEILEGGLAPKAIVMSWRGEAGGITAAKQKHEVIMTPGNPVYFDHSQSENEDSVTIGGYNPIEKVYAYNPVPKELNADEAKYILGAQANLWTEYIKNPKKVEYMLLPRLSALSEVLWSPLEKKDWKGFEKRLTEQFKRYDFWKANYSKAYFDIKATIIPATDNKGVIWKLESKQNSSSIKYISHSAGMINSSGFANGKDYTTPILVNSSMITAAIIMQNGKAIGNPVSQTFIINKATGKKIFLAGEASPNYPGDGAFTLVNGVQNEKGLAKSKEFLGFSGSNCEAIINLDSIQLIKKVTVHTIRQTGSWIWRPLTVEVFISDNGKDFTSVGLTDDFIVKKAGLETGKMIVSFDERETKFIKVIVTNWGEIPAGDPGAGKKAWLFVDEIEVN